MSKSVTLQMIADEVGVSKQSVSNAYRRPDELSDDLRQRILQTAAAMGYTGPDPSALALRRGRTGAVGVVLTESASDAVMDPAASGFLAGVADALEAQEQDLLLMSGRPGTGSAVDAVSRAAVDGFLLYSVHPEDACVGAVHARHLPAVFVDQAPESADVVSVGIDDRAAGRMLMDHLAGLGHERVAVLSLRVLRDGASGPVTPERERGAVFPLTRRRLEGFREAAPSIEFVWECPGVVADVHGAVDLLLDSGATALASMSDVFALAAIAELERRGLRVPEDVSVAGIDDVEAAGPAGLTTVAQDHRAKGKAAVQALESRESVVLPCELVARATTAAPRSPGGRAS